MQIYGDPAPDKFGQLTFVGNPHEVREGDVLYAGGDEFAVRNKPKPGNNFGKPATELVLCEEGAYSYEVPRGGEPEALVRITLDNRLKVRFKRTVLVDDLDFGEESQLFYDLPDCEDPFAPEDAEEGPKDPNDPHAHHSDYQIEWRGKCRAVPKGMLVGINLEPDGAPIKCTEKIVDSVYPNGAVVFSDGTSFQSHPDKEWVGWLNEAARSAEVLR